MSRLPWSSLPAVPLVVPLPGGILLPGPLVVLGLVVLGLVVLPLPAMPLAVLLTGLRGRLIVPRGS